MGAIETVCAANNLTLESLASWLGMLPTLLAAMDANSQVVPTEIEKALGVFCRERRTFADGMKQYLASALERNDEMSIGIVPVYVRKEDYEGAGIEIYPHDIHRHFLEYAAEKISGEARLVLVEFDKASYERWLAGRKDMPELRTIWAVWRKTGRDMLSKKDSKLNQRRKKENAVQP